LNSESKAGNKVKYLVSGYGWYIKRAD